MSERAVVQACPFGGKTCRNGKREDFAINPDTQERFVCAKWVNLRGKDPQSEKVFDNWMCSEAAVPTLLVEVAQMVRFNQASTDKVASEVRSHHVTFAAALNKRLQDADLQTQIENKG